MGRRRYNSHEVYLLAMKDLKLLCVGDAFIARRIGVYEGEPDVAPLFKRIRDADVSFINVEIAIHSYEGYPIGEGKYDAYGQADPHRRGRPEGDRLRHLQLRQQPCYGLQRGGTEGYYQEPRQGGPRPLGIGDEPRRGEGASLPRHTPRAWLASSQRARGT